MESFSILGIDLALSGPTGIALLRADAQETDIELLPIYNPRARRTGRKTMPDETVTDYHMFLAYSFYEHLRSIFSQQKSSDYPVRWVGYEIPDWHMPRGSRGGGIGRNRTVLTALGEAKGFTHLSLALLREDGFRFKARSIGAREAKKHITGRGNCNKKTMVKEVMRRCPSLPKPGRHTDAHEAAAICLTFLDRIKRSN